MSTILSSTFSPTQSDINLRVEQHTECQADNDHQDDEAQCAAVSYTCSVGAAESHSDPFYPINAGGR